MGRRGAPGRAAAAAGDLRCAAAPDLGAHRRPARGRRGARAGRTMKGARMDHSRVPVLEALEEFRRRDDAVFGPPSHRQGKGADPRVLELLGEGVFRSDVLSLNGLDDRRESQGILEQAQDLMADAVHAETAFFSTCGSSLSVKTAIISVAGPGEKLLVSRNAHKSVIAGVIIAGIDP